MSWASPDEVYAVGQQVILTGEVNHLTTNDIAGHRRRPLTNALGFSPVVLGR
ncbi:MAG: hypothetical protein JO166_04520 [Deltaproteobacteria bacterium]|nr:hypothetical protein [Deltaproteobacteria bacterium]